MALSSSNATPSTVPTTELLTTQLIRTTLSLINGTTAEPEPSVEPSPEREPHPEPELFLKWPEEKELWGVAWPIHWIGFTMLFLIFASAVGYSLGRMLSRRRFSRRDSLIKFRTTVWSVLFVFGLSRAFYMFLNPYENNKCILGEKKHCPLALNRIIFSLGLPGLTTAFLLFHFAFIEVTKIEGRARLNKLQSTPFLVGFTIFNYVFVITADLIVSYYANLNLLVKLCQVYFILLGICIILLFLYSASRIVMTSQQNWNSLQRLQNGKSGAEDARKSRFYVTPQLRKVIRLAILTICIWSVYVIFQIITFVQVLTGGFKNWSFLAFETLYRICELLLGLALFFAITTRPNTDATDGTTRSASRRNTGKSESSGSPATFHSKVKLVNYKDHNEDEPREPILADATAV